MRLLISKASPPETYALSTPIDYLPGALADTSGVPALAQGPCAALVTRVVRAQGPRSGCHAHSVDCCLDGLRNRPAPHAWNPGRSRGPSMNYRYGVGFQAPGRAVISVRSVVQLHSGPYQTDCQTRGAAGPALSQPCRVPGPHEHTANCNTPLQVPPLGRPARWRLGPDAHTFHRRRRPRSSRSGRTWRGPRLRGHVDQSLPPPPGRLGQ